MEYIRRCEHKHMNTVEWKMLAEETANIPMWIYAEGGFTAQDFEELL